MNIVVISTCGPMDIFILRQIERHWPIRHLFRPVWKSRRRESALSLRDRIFALSPRRWTRKIRQAFYTRQDHRIDRIIEKRLFENRPPVLEAEIESLPAESFNTPPVEQRFRKLAPDILFVSGGPILREGILSVPRVAAVNVHFGIAPAYRGIHTVFWPLYRDDYDHIGVTLHHINRGIDTGRILARGYPALEPSDTEATIWAKLAPVAAAMIVPFFETVGHGDISGRPQTEKGELFLAGSRKLRHDAIYQIRRLSGHRPPRQPGRIESFFTSTAADTLIASEN